MRLRYAHYNSRSAARVDPLTHAILTLHKRPPKTTRLCGNLSVCRRHNNTMDLQTNSLNNVLAELQEWCDRNSMVPHPGKCKATIMQRKSTFTGPIQALRLGNNIIKWTTSERLLGVQVDNKLSWPDQAANVAKAFASKLSLLWRMRFLPQKQLEDYYTKVIMPSVTYGLAVWGSGNKKHLNNLEKLHGRAGRILYGLPWDTSAEDVWIRTRWDSLETMYKLRLTEFVFRVTPSRNLKICFYRGILAAEEMRTSFSRDQKQIISVTPYALEEQSHGTL